MNPDKELTGSGLACATLTPGIKAAMSTMEGNKVLKVFSDDPSAREGVPAWCRLTGNKLLEMKELNSSETIFYIQKKNTTP